MFGKKHNYFWIHFLSFRLLNIICLNRDDFLLKIIEIIICCNILAPAEKDPLIGDLALLVQDLVPLVGMKYEKPLAEVLDLAGSILVIAL